MTLPRQQLWYCYFDISTELVFPSDFRQIVQTSWARKGPRRRLSGSQPGKRSLAMTIGL